jgi:hypothetical protein
MVDLAPARHFVCCVIRQQFFNLLTAFRRYRIDPWPTDPFFESFLGEFVVAARDIANDALGIDHERNIRRCRYKLSGYFGVQISQSSFGGPEHDSWISSKHRANPHTKDIIVLGGLSTSDSFCVKET